MRTQHAAQRDACTFNRLNPRAAARQTGHNSRLNSQIADKIKNALVALTVVMTDVRRRDGSQSGLPSIYIQLRPATFSHAKLVQLPLTVSPFLPRQPDLARASTGLYALLR